MLYDIIDVLLYKKQNKELAMYITKDNIQESLIYQKKELEKYMYNNQTEIKNYIETPFDRKNFSNSRKIITYLKDIPEHLRYNIEQDNE